MPDHDPIPRRRLTARQARTVRHWIMGLAASSLIVIGLSPVTSEDQDKVITLVVAATLATGAIVVRRPVGFRVILALASTVSVASALGWIRL